MNCKHTPGPWTVLAEEVHRTYIRIRGTRLGGRYKVANVLSAEYTGAPDREAEETRANARLIAEAPAMLEALREILHATDGSNPSHIGQDQAFAIARAVIRRATGESA